MVSRERGGGRYENISLYGDCLVGSACHNQGLRRQDGEALAYDGLQGRRYHDGGIPDTRDFNGLHALLIEVPRYHDEGLLNHRDWGCHHATREHSVSGVRHTPEMTMNKL
jgi:hypothetical protein